MEDGILSDVWMLEPLTGATLECLHGIAQEGQTRVSPPTSYKRVLALRAGPLAHFFAHDESAARSR
jgi:hypothetical protein